MADYRTSAALLMGAIAAAIPEAGAKRKLIKDAFYELEMARNFKGFDLEAAKLLRRSVSTTSQEKLYAALAKAGIIGKAGIAASPEKS